MAMKIGITASPNQIDGRRIDEVSSAYASCVVRAGGLPVIIPVLDPVHAGDMLDGLDGLLLSGGGDIEPGRYGRATVPEVGGVDPARDEWELALVPAAIDRNLPVLGICRGAQVINVAAGGTLIPHLEAITDQDHRQRELYGQVIHPIDLLPGSRLAGAMARVHAGVNTLHHQAVDEVGLGLRAVAWSPDGVIEAIESISHARVLGVQWHPELLPDVPGHPELFGWLVDEARRSRTMVEAMSAALAPMAHAPGTDLVEVA